MNIIGKVIAGDTARIRLPLLEDGSAVDGTGLQVTAIEIKGWDGTVVDTTNDIGWDNQGGGIAYYDPDAGDFVAGNAPYSVRVLLTDGSGKTRHYPNGAPAFLMVRAA